MRNTVAFVIALFMIVALSAPAVAMEPMEPLKPLDPLVYDSNEKWHVEQYIPVPEKDKEEVEIPYRNEFDSEKPKENTVTIDQKKRVEREPVIGIVKIPKKGEKGSPIFFKILKLLFGVIIFLIIGSFVVDI